jgi:hypothetical protein
MYLYIEPLRSPKLAEANPKYVFYFVFLLLQFSKWGAGATGAILKVVLNTGLKMPHGPYLITAM